MTRGSNRLLAYDWAIFRRSFQAAFSRPQDIALLLLVAFVGLAFLRDTVARALAAGLPPAAWLGVALAGLIAFSAQNLLLARLRWFAERTPLAGDALRTFSRGQYLAAGHAALLVLVLPAVWIIGVGLRAPGTVAAAGACAYFAGLLFGGLPGLAGLADGLARPSLRPPLHGTGRAALFELILRRQIGGARPLRRAGLVVGLGFAAPLFAGLVPAGTPATIALLGLAFGVLLMVGRTDAEALGILPFAGYRPGFVAAAYAALPAAFAAALALGALAAPRPQTPVVLIGLGLMLAGLMLLGIARCWLYPGRAKRSVDLQVQLEFAGLVLAAWLVPPLALLAIVWRMSILYRRARSLLWLQL
ncbi:MAG TPA: hypothetical protein VEW04_01455 [Allosphingosinicella sp.]|nr:hypothetical protein [Allosphingosinicella sp.]